MDDEDDAAVETETLANSFAEKNVTLTLENNQLKREAESLETATRKLETELRQAQAKEARTAAALEEQQVRADTLDEELGLEKARAAEESAELRGQLDQVRQELEQQHVVEMQKLRSELDHAKAQSGEGRHWKAERQELRDEVDDLQVQLRKAKAAPIPEAVPDAGSEEMMAEAAEEVRRLQREMQGWKSRAEKAEASVKESVSDVLTEEAQARGFAKRQPEPEPADAEEVEALRQQLAAQEEEREEQLQALRKVHSGEMAKINRQMLALRAKIGIKDGTDTPTRSESPTKAKKPAAGSAADPLLREQQRLKKALSEQKREVAAKESAMAKLEEEVSSLKEEAKRQRKRRAGEKKEWEAAQEALRAEVGAAQSNDAAIVAQVEAIADETRGLSAEVALWQERAAAEEEEKERLQAHLDELAEGGKQAAGNLVDASQPRMPPLSVQVEEAVATALSSGQGGRVWEDSGRGGSRTGGLVEALCKTQLMASSLRSLATEVQSTMGTRSRSDELPESPLSSSRSRQARRY